MLPILPIATDIFSDAISSVTGWAWDKVVQGIFTWFAQGLMLLIEVVWNFLDGATTPHVTDDWFINGVVASLAPIALFVTVAMMLMTAIQAALSGRPELIGDAVVSGVRAIIGTAFTLIVMDTLIRFADVVADSVWTQARPDIRSVVDSIVAGVLGGSGWGATFLGPIALLLGMIGMLVTAVLLFMRSTMLYFVAAFAPLVWSSSVLPMMRGSVRKLVHTTVALVLAKPAIVMTLAIGMRLVAASPLAADDGGSDVTQIGMLLTGFFAFGVAALSPWVVYKLLPSAEGAAMHSGVAGGWGRSGMTAANAAMMARSVGKRGGAATKQVPDGTNQSQGPDQGSTGFSAPTTPTTSNAASPKSPTTTSSGATGSSAAAGPAAPVVVAATVVANATKKAATSAAAQTASSGTQSGEGRAASGGPDAAGTPNGGARRVVIPPRPSDVGGSA